MWIKTTNTEQFRGKGQAPKIPRVPGLLLRLKARCGFACPLTPSSLRTAQTFSLRLQYAEAFADQGACVTLFSQYRCFSGATTGAMIPRNAGPSARRMLYGPPD